MCRIYYFRKNLVFWVDGTCDIHRIDNVTEISLICHSSYTSWKKDRCPYWVSVLFLFEDFRRFSAFYIDLSHGMWTSDSRRKGWLCVQSAVLWTSIPQRLALRQGCSEQLRDQLLLCDKSALGWRWQSSKALWLRSSAASRNLNLFSTFTITYLFCANWTLKSYMLEVISNWTCISGRQTDTLIHEREHKFAGLMCRIWSESLPFVQSSIHYWQSRWGKI
mgnify:CR=1 FL=1